MDNRFTAFLTSTGDTIIKGGSDEAVSSEQEATTEQADNTGGSTQQAGGMGWSWIIIYVVVIFGMFWLMSRPQRKREKELEELQNNLAIGDDVVTSGGFYGKIVDMDDNLVTIEFGTNKGVRIPVSKSEIYPSKKLSEIKED